MNQYIDFSQFGDPIVVVSHPRSGTHLTLDLLRKQFEACQSSKKLLEPNHYLYLSIEGFLEQRKGKKLREEAAIKIIKRMRRPLIKFHTYSYPALREKFPEWMDWLETKGKFVFVVRNVSDVLSSYYQYAQSFEPNSDVPISEFIKQSYCGRINRPFYWNEVVLDWPTRRNVLTVKYEDLIRSTEKSLLEIGDFISEKPLLRYPLLPEQVKSLWFQRFYRFVSKKPESTAILADSRFKPQASEAFTEEDFAFMEANAREAMIYYNYIKVRT